MSETLRIYFDALNRLKNNRPLLVPVGTQISNDSVSLEAGRRKGSIKRSRVGFADLISAIRSAAEAQRAPDIRAQRTLERSKLDASTYKAHYEAQLAERAAVLLEMQRLRKMVAMLDSDYRLQTTELEAYKRMVIDLRSELIELRSAKLRVVSK